jgi:hypothetical protein
MVERYNRAQPDDHGSISGRIGAHNRTAIGRLTPVSLVGEYRGLALQDQADELGLTMRASLIEHMREVCPSRGQRDGEPVRRRLQPVGSISRA